MKRNAFTLMEVLIGAFLFVMVAVICSAIFAYTVSNRNKAHQQNQINQTAKNFFEEIGQHLRSTNSSQKIKICGTGYFNIPPSDPQEYEISGEFLGYRKIGLQLRIFYGNPGADNILYIYYPHPTNYNIVRQIFQGSFDEHSLDDCSTTPIGPNITSESKILNPSDIKLSLKRQGTNVPPLQVADGPYFAFMGCDDYMNTGDGFVCEGYGPIIRVFIGLEGGIQIKGKGVSGTSSVFQTTFTTRRAP